MAFQLRPSVKFVDHTVDQEIFTLKIIHIKKFCGFKFSWFVPSTNFFLMFDHYNMDENQVSVAVTLWLSGVVIDQTFTSGSVDVRTQAYSFIIAA